jgi:hypothetical protein
VQSGPHHHLIENAPDVLQQLNLPIKRNNVDKGKNPYGNLLLNL